MPKVHFESIRRLRGFTITGMLCDRMASGNEINSTPRRHEVTCKFCLRLLMPANNLRIVTKAEHHASHRRAP